MKINILNIVFICFVGFILIPACIHAQQAVQYSQQAFNKYEMNTAYAGFDYSLSVTGHYRNQWSGLGERPLSQNINVHLPLYIINGGIGFSIQNDKFGSIGNTGFRGSYNYVYQSPIGLFSFGGNIGFQQTRIDGSAFRSGTGIYEGELQDHRDPILFNTSLSQIGPSYGLAMYFKETNLEAGISISNFPSNRVSLAEIDFERRNIFNIYGEYDIHLTESIEITPSIFFKTDLAQLQGEFFSFVSYEQRYFSGIGLRGYSGNTLDALTLMAGLQLSRHYRVSYSYDIGLNGLRNNHEGTHEFIVNYNLAKAIGIGLPPKIIYNPRYLD